ncbi:MAG: twin-arginine translocation signal domain-containing protein, partial [Gemmatimonadetes bacterium]|nr:twin-arginine translocation signal domain-containing protein [Gemmatimonadota bacterium]
MPTTRRDFLQTAAAGVAGVSMIRSPFGRVVTPQPQSASLRILVLGGTGFIGPHLVRYAVQRGNTVTI